MSKKTIPRFYLKEALTIIEIQEKMAEQDAQEIKGVLKRLKENIAKLQPSFEEVVAEQAEMLIGDERKKLRKAYKAECKDLLRELKEVKSEMEECITDIDRNTRKCIHEVNRDMDEKFRAVIRQERLKRSKELDEIRVETKNNTIVELLSPCNKYQVMKISVNSNFVSMSTPRCASCGKESVWLYFCGGCKISRYCDEKCQEADWESHKNTCIGLNNN